MNCTQTSICLPKAGLFVRGLNALCGGTSLSKPQTSHLSFSSLNVSATHQFRHYKASSRLIYGAPKNKRCAPVCANGGKGSTGSGNEAFSWDSLKKAMGGLGKQQSIESLLRKQMQEPGFDGDGGGRSPPGDGGDGNGNGGSEDENFAGILDELLQVIMATIGFIFVYIYFIRGEELTRLAKDYIKYLFGGKTSVRLRRTMYKWRKFYESITWKPPREDWLERAIVATPTWWHKPRKLARWMKTMRSARSYDES